MYVDHVKRNFLKWSTIKIVNKMMCDRVSNILFSQNYRSKFNCSCFRSKTQVNACYQKRSFLLYHCCRLIQAILFFVKKAECVSCT